MHRRLDKKWLFFVILAALAVGFEGINKRQNKYSIGLIFASAIADEIAWSDPEKIPIQKDAVGYPSRSDKLDVLPGFKNPPKGYGEVAFYWWLGDPLTRERLQWQIKKLSGKSIMGLQINYAHNDHGGYTYGLPFASDPPLFSDAWWDLTKWFMSEAQKYGMAISLSDYTLGAAGQGYYIDEVLRDYPGICGATLSMVQKDIQGGNRIEWTLPDNTIAAMAFKRSGETIVPGSGVHLHPFLKDRLLIWTAPQGDWKLTAVCFKSNPHSFDPMNPQSGPAVIEKFYQKFEDKIPGQAGKGLNFFFSDELQFGVRGNLWNDRFAAEFQKRKGYDILPELAGLFLDIGPRTEKIRLDYRDVMVDLSEECYFRPVFDWHQQRGMIFGCDHGGRGQDVVEFGDYFRTQRWTQGPGSDQPRLSKNLIKAKVAASISHLYQRPRVWLEGFYSSGWGTSTAQLTDATLANYAMGYNLLTLHGLYYSTHGGWWEWAPPCNHFRQPYWDHMGEFLKCMERLSYLLSQGVHQCDVAILYPVAPMEANLSGKESVNTAFDIAEVLYGQGIDFDFMDFQSLARSEVRDRQLLISGERYRFLILPAMRAVRWSTVQKVLEFHRAGGIVLAVGALPEASDRAGRQDAELNAVVQEVFTKGDNQLTDAKSAAAKINQAFPGDYKGPGDIMHRKIGSRDIYFVYGVPRNTECFFRAKGRTELWNPWTGQTTLLYAVSETADGTMVKMPLTEKEAQIIVFNPGQTQPAITETNLDEITDIRISGDAITVKGYTSEPGEKTANVRIGDRSTVVRGQSAALPETIVLDGQWQFELKPVLDNRWGDFRLPVTDQLMGPEARIFCYKEEESPNPGWQSPDYDDSKWTRVACGFGPKFWKLGPISPEINFEKLNAKLSSLEAVDPSVPVQADGKQYKWTAYDFSWRWGVQNNPGRQGYHGLKENITDDFICLGKQVPKGRTDTAYLKEEGGEYYYLWTSAYCKNPMDVKSVFGDLKPAAIYLNGHLISDFTAVMKLKRGNNSLLICYNKPGRGHFVLEKADAEKPEQRTPLSMQWYDRKGVIPFDVYPEKSSPAGWYRFVAPPGLKSMMITARGSVQAWADGQEVKVEKLPSKQGDSMQYSVKLPKPLDSKAKVALRVEQEHGFYGGSTLPEPVRLECGPGMANPGDWSKDSVLECYSGGAWYRKSVSLTKEQLAGRVILDMGNVVSSAEVRINGCAAGIRVAPPWRLEISSYMKTGQNEIEILVYNTAGNHYLTIPTDYRGSTESGLMGPVRIEIARPVELK